MRSGKQKKGIFFGIFFELTKDRGSLLFKLGFPKDFRISSRTQLGEHPNLALKPREVSHSRDPKLRFLFRLFFYFITIILITILQMPWNMFDSVFVEH